MDWVYRKIVVTGSKGFIGRHLMETLNRCSVLEVRGFDIDSSHEELAAALKDTNIIFHLAGVNRPDRVEEYEKGNHLFTKKLCTILEEANQTPVVVFSSSTQVELDNPYGKSKLRAEETLRDWSKRTDAGVAIFRLKNVFGKWCRPNYNSVVATFCHNIARDIPIQISDPSREIELVHIDDVVASFLGLLARTHEGAVFHDLEPVFRIKLGDLAEKLYEFRKSRENLRASDLADPFLRRLYGTYMSYLPYNGFSYSLERKTDSRGDLAEIVKANGHGQFFFSRTKPGIIRGNHYHELKVEKFIVLEGEALIKFRNLATDEKGEYSISGRDLNVVDIPPGWTHSIQNVGTTDMIVLFWASEVFDADRPDTYPAEV